MDLRNRKGQLGPIGEDLIHIIIVGFAISFILIATVKAYTDYAETYRRLDTYRMGLARAEKASSDYAWAPDNIKRTHILDSEKLDAGLDCAKLSGLCIIDGSSQKKWSCGNPACNGGDSTTASGDVSVVSIPVTIRVDAKNYHHGIVEVTLVSK